MSNLQVHPMTISVQALAIAIVFLLASNCLAITIGQVDDFDALGPGETADWQGSMVAIANDANGFGDSALRAETTGVAGGPNSKLVIANPIGPGPAATPTQWTGDWLGAGISRIELDIRNDSDLPLTLWMGIAGPGGAGFMGFGDTYVSNTSHLIPADDQWYRVGFNVSPADFTAVGATNDAAAALAAVDQLRFMHAASQNWQGDIADASMYIDDITAVPEPSATVLAALGVLGLLTICCHRIADRRRPAGR